MNCHTVTSKLKVLHPAAFTAVFTAVFLLWMTLFNCTVELFGIPDIELLGSAPSIEEYGIAKMILFGVLIVPMVETLLFQALPFGILSGMGFFRRHKWLIILISAVLFSVEHVYSVQYMIYTFIGGIWFMYAYLISPRGQRIWRVFATHALVNGIITLIEVLFP